MQGNKKAKWIVGITGAAFSAFMLSQLDNSNNENQGQTNEQVSGVEINDTMSEREKELVMLDWSDFSVQESNVQNNNTINDRTTRRSG